MSDEFTISTSPPEQPHATEPVEPSLRISSQPQAVDNGNNDGERMVVVYAPHDWPSLHDRLCAQLAERPAVGAKTVSVWLRSGNDDPHAVWRAIRMIRERGDDLQVVAPDRVWGTSVLWLVAADRVVTGPWLTVDGLDSPLRVPGTTNWHTTAGAIADELSNAPVNADSGQQRLLDMASGKAQSHQPSLEEQHLMHREQRLDRVVAESVLRWQARKDLATIRRYAQQVGSDDDAGRDLIEHLCSASGVAGRDLVRLLAAAKIDVVSCDLYAHWPVVVRLLAAMWRTQEPIVWVVSQKEAEQL